jgi:hypothetical protein
LVQEIETIKTIEAYLLKGGKETALKIPLPQLELHEQMARVLSHAVSSPWDTILSMSASDQADVAYVLETAKEQDDRERILVAIEKKEDPSSTRWWNRRRTRLRHILLFLNIVVRPPRPTWTRMARRYLSVETLNHFHLPYQVVGYATLLAIAAGSRSHLNANHLIIGPESGFPPHQALGAASRAGCLVGPYGRAPREA